MENSLHVTKVSVYPHKTPKGNTVATVSIHLNDAIALTGLRIVKGSNGLFVSYPCDPSYQGEDYKSLFYPLTKELRDYIENTIIAKYHEIQLPKVMA